MTPRVQRPGCRSNGLISRAGHLSERPLPVGEFANAARISSQADRKLAILSRRQQGRRMDKTNRLPHPESGRTAPTRQKVGAPTFSFWKKVAA